MPIQLVKPGVIKPNTPEYFAVCGLAGILSCGVTHTFVTPIDMVKCNKQNNPARFNKGMFGNMGILAGIKGPKGLVRGWAPTFVGYSFQGLGKFGLNDFFKFKYEQLLGHQFKVDNPKIYYAMCSGSAEFFADLLLCPWETVKLKVPGAMRSAAPCACSRSHTCKHTHHTHTHGRRCKRLRSTRGSRARARDTPTAWSTGPSV